MAMNSQATEKDQQNSHQRCQDVLQSLRKIMQAVDLHSRGLYREYGITGPQLVLLQEIASNESISVTELAKSTSLSQATVTDIIVRLEKKGLVTKTKSEIDKRRVELYPTGNCLRLLEKAPPPLQETFINQFSRLEEWEQFMILSALKRIVSIMATKKIEASSILAAGPITDTPNMEVL